MKRMAGKVIALGFVLILGFPGASRAQKLVVGYSGITAIQAPFWIMNDAGFFKQEGLEANLVYIAASSTMAQAMMAGEVWRSLRRTVKRSSIPAFRGAIS